MGARDEVVTANGLRLRFLDWGTRGKPPVLLLHGLRGHAHAWDDVSAAWCADDHVRIDRGHPRLPGRGRPRPSPLTDRGGLRADFP
jgi:pimeloyl-ACP methyl ester carboxylesterase